MLPWGCTTFIHHISYEYEKLGPKGKKCIFIRYLELSKKYVFVGEDMIGRVAKIESRDVIFLEEDFPKRGEINEDFRLYEMEDSRQVRAQDILIQLLHSKMVWDIMRLLKLVRVKSCQILLIWNKIMNNINLDVVIVRKFLVVDLRLRGKPDDCP